MLGEHALALQPPSGRSGKAGSVSARLITNRYSTTTRIGHAHRRAAAEGCGTAVGRRSRGWVTQGSQLSPLGASARRGTNESSRCRRVFWFGPFREVLSTQSPV